MYFLLQTGMTTSQFGKDKAAKDVECYAQEKCSRTSLNRQDITNIFTEVTQLDEIDFQRMSSPTSSIYSDAQNSVIAFSCRNRCFGDFRAPPSETTPKSAKDISVLGESILKQIFVKQNLTTTKSIHVDIPPENKCVKNNGECSSEDLSEIREIHALKNKVSAGKTDSEEILEDDSNKEIQDTRRNLDVTRKKFRYEDACDGALRKEFQEARSKLVVTPKKIRYEDTCDDERKFRWSPEESKIGYFRRNLAEANSTDSFIEPILKEEHFSNYSRRQNFPREITTLLRNANPPQERTETAESSAQTDNPNVKSKQKSKFKTALLDFFLSCVKCFM